MPDAKLSAELAALLPRMRAVEATQRAQEADVAELRARSERAMRAWYEGRVLRYGQAVADAEGRFERVEMGGQEGGEGEGDGRCDLTAGIFFLVTENAETIGAGWFWACLGEKRACGKLSFSFAPGLSAA